MIIVLQLVLYCLLFFLLVKCAARDNGLNCLYFYSDEYQQEAKKRGFADDLDAVKKKGKRFMIPFCIVMLIALILIIAVWNHVTDFKTAYIQTVIFLVVMNWFDGIMIDRIWVGYSKIWRIKGMEGVPYVKSWKTIFTRRGLGTLLYLIIALAVAGIIMLVGNLI